MGKKDQLIRKFLVYLKEKGVSQRSLKNYCSDLSHFTNWLILKIRDYGVLSESLSQCLAYLNQDLAEEYKKHLLTNSSVRTINRRLSTLRHLAQFLQKTQTLSSNFMLEVANISFADKKPNKNQVLELYKKHLHQENISHNTIKNYLSDINHFILWLEKQNHARSA